MASLVTGRALFLFVERNFSAGGVALNLMGYLNVRVLRAVK